MEIKDDGYHCIKCGRDIGNLAPMANLTCESWGREPCQADSVAMMKAGGPINTGDLLTINADHEAVRSVGYMQDGSWRTAVDYSGAEDRGAYMTGKMDPVTKEIAWAADNTFDKIPTNEELTAAIGAMHEISGTMPEAGIPGGSMVGPDEFASGPWHAPYFVKYLLDRLAGMSGAGPFSVGYDPALVIGETMAIQDACPYPQQIESVPEKAGSLPSAPTIDQSSLPWGGEFIADRMADWRNHIAPQEERRLISLAMRREARVPYCDVCQRPVMMKLNAESLRLEWVCDDQD